MAELVSDLTGAPHAANVGSVSPVALVTGFFEAGLTFVCDQRPVDGRTNGLTDGQLVGGPLVQVGLQAIGTSGRFPVPVVWGALSTKFFCRPGMKLPVQSIWPPNNAVRAPVLEV